MRGIFDIDNPVMRGLIKFFDCICLSLLWLLFSLPVVTMGASSAALYTTTYKYLRKGEGHLWKTFWSAFRGNLKRSTIVWLVALAVMALLVVDALVFRTWEINGNPLGKIYWVVLVLCCIAITWSVYLSAYAARFDGSAKDVLRFGFILMVAHPIKALGVFLPILCGAMLLIIAPAMIALVPAAVCWLNSVILEQVFLLHMRPEDAQRVQLDDNGSE